MTQKKDWLEERLQNNPDLRHVLEREGFIEEFLRHVEDVRERQGVSRVELADRMDCAPSNITRIMRRTANLTAATMVDLAHALGLRIRAKFEPLDELPLRSNAYDCRVFREPYEAAEWSSTAVHEDEDELLETVSVCVLKHAA